MHGDSERPTLAVTAALLSIVVVGACEAEPGEDRTAAVPVVEPELELQIGRVDDSEYALTAVTGMEVGPSGRMYTLHRGEQIVRVFAPDGSLETVFGGRGEGPGEFQSASTMGWVADTLWVLDLDGYRFSYFASDGTFYRSFAVPYLTGEDPREVQPPRARGLLSDGTVWGGPPAFSSQVQAGTFTHNLVMRLNRDGTVIDTLTRIPVGRNTWGISDPENPEGGGMYTRQPFADGPLWTFVPGADRLVLLDRAVGSRADGSSFRLAGLSFAGDTVFSRSYDTPPVPIENEEVEQILARMTESLIENPMLGGMAPGSARRWVEHGFYRPEVRPAVTAMVVGTTGEIWLEETVAEGEPHTWLRLSPTGEPLQRVTLPEEVTVRVADEERIWGVRTDELGVPYLVRYRIPS